MVLSGGWADGITTTLSVGDGTNQTFNYSQPVNATLLIGDN
jgi:hypothetical protein